jgi:tetratricopeptide (TPR) repeat protein
MDKHFQHALVLFEQERFDRAEEKLRLSLADNPDFAFAHALLAHCLCERQRLDEATAEANEAIRLEPGEAAGHMALSRVLYQRNRYDEADRAIQEALRLEPENPEHFERRAGIALGRRDWPAALDNAEQGLVLDPEHVGCNNLRALALVKLGRQEEAGATLATTLARDPDNALSHANQGWALLHAGQRQKALEHFREALRLEPGMDWARAGIVEALKSKNFLYALMLRYFLWMGRLSRGLQWAIILGGYFAYRGLLALTELNPKLAPWIWPLLVLYFLFAILTWLAAPLFNLLLRLNRFGRHALSRDQRVASNWVGGFLAVALVLAGVWLFTDSSLALMGAVYFGLLLLPLSAIFNCAAGWPRWMMIFYVAALAFLGVAYLPLFLFVSQQLAVFVLQVFLWGCVLSGLVANYLAMQLPRR